MDNARNILDYIMEKFPVNSPGCVNLGVFHSHMLNDVFPAYARLIEMEATDEVWISTVPHEITQEMSQGSMLTYDPNTTTYPVYRLDFDPSEPAVPPDGWDANNPMIEPFPLQDE